MPQRSSGSSSVSATDPTIVAARGSYRHAQQLRQFNEDIFRRHVLTDVELVVQGETVRSHRSVLVCFSPYLRRKLLGTDGKPTDNRVHIPKVGKEEFNVLLHYMYTGDLNTTFNNFLELYEAASILEMKDVMQECLQILEPNNDIRTYFYLYVTSKKLGVRANWERALRLLAHRFEEVVCAPEFLQLPVDYIVELLSEQDIGARSEVIVFLAVLKWLSHSYTTRCEHVVRVMECVRFSSMTMDEIVACYHPPFLPQVLNNPKIVTMLFRANCYITAKFLGQESWFKNLGNQKRNLAFKNLPMELWHQRSSPIVSDMDIARNWKETMDSKFPNNRTKNTTDNEKQFHLPQELGNKENHMSSKTYLAEALRKVIQHSELRQSSAEISEAAKKSTREVSRKNQTQVIAQNTPSFVEASETNINMDELSHETHTIEAESLGPESVISLTEAKHRGSDFVVQIDAPVFPEDLDEYPVKEYTKTEMSDAQVNKTIEENSDATERKGSRSGELRGGGPNNQNSRNKDTVRKFFQEFQKTGYSSVENQKGSPNTAKGKKQPGSTVSQTRNKSKNQGKTLPPFNRIIK